MEGEFLAGGVANAGAVRRVGDHVLRPANPHSASVHRFLAALQAVGFDGASNPVRVEDGVERLVYIPGEVALPPYPDWAQTDTALASLSRLMRSFHDASAIVGVLAGPWSDEIADPAGGAVICHNDVCFENVVFRGHQAVGLLDFDFSAPGRPNYDLAVMARMCVPIDDDLSAARLGWRAADRPKRLRLVADTYGLDASGRNVLLAILSDGIERRGEFVRRRVEAGDPNFIAMWEEMGGIERYERRWRWWSIERDRFASSLR